MLAASRDRLAFASSDDTTIVAMQAFVPPHTPQLSSEPSQHAPDGASGCEQQIPFTSRITPLPPHTPHASTTPELQHRPSPSVTAPASQHRPVTLSMAAADSQHVPLTSTSSATAVQFPSNGSKSTTSQSCPAQPSRHAQTPSGEQAKFGPSVLHSELLVQTHGPKLHSLESVGAGSEQAAVFTIAPSPARRHCTSRV